MARDAVRVWTEGRYGTARGELDGMVRRWVEETEGLWSGESVAAGQAVSCYGHVGEELVWRHLDVFEHRGEIRCHLPRGQRTAAGKVDRVSPPWEGLAKHFTQGFQAMVLLWSRQIVAGGSGNEYWINGYAVVAAVARARRSGVARGRLGRGRLRGLRRAVRAQWASRGERVLRLDR